MAQTPQLFQHASNSAWLVLATLEALRSPLIFDLSAQLGALIDEEAPMIIVEGQGSEDQDVQGVLERMEDLFTPKDIQVQALDDFSLGQNQGRVGALILVGGSPQDWVTAGHRFQSVEHPPDFPFVDLTLAVGGACAAAGEWRLSWPSTDEIEVGLGWLPNGIVAPGLSHPGDLPAIRDLLANASGSFAIGLPPGGSIALGPSGELEIWSEVKPGIILGKGWGQA